MLSSGSATGWLAAEIGIDHLRMRADIGRSSGRELLAEIEHGDVMADVEDQVGMVLHQEHAGAGLGDLDEERAEPPYLLGREAGGRLVEQQEGRTQHKGAGDL